MGCIAPREHLSFPDAPISISSSERAYDVDGDGVADFMLRTNNHRLDLLEYDDNRDGASDRTYRLSAFNSDQVPHLIILVDSLPYQQTLDYYQENSWTWFDPPVKVIAPFPTMSAVIFSELLGAPPQSGAINQYFDQRTNKRVNRILHRLGGDGNSWERRLHYRLGYLGNGQSFLNPRPWFSAELAWAKQAFDKSPDRMTVVYLASSAGMLSKNGSQGLIESLDGIEKLCMQILYERAGAVKISVVSDHGHNLRSGVRIDVPAMLKEAGLNPRDHLVGQNDVVVEQDGLVNYVGIHTRRARYVAQTLADQPEIELAMWLDGQRVMIRSAHGTAAVEFHDGRLRYTPLDADVLGYKPILEFLSEEGLMDSERFVSSEDWFDATIDHRWPDAPSRLWHAFHGVVVSTPTVMVTTASGFYVGKPSFDRFIDMASTHGGLDQTDSASVLLTMTGRALHPLRTRNVMRTIEPEYDPSRLRKK